MPATRSCPGCISPSNRLKKMENTTSILNKRQIAELLSKINSQAKSLNQVVF
jgi:hypothetical protein